MFAVTFTIPDFVLGLMIGGISVFIVMLVVALHFGKGKDV